MTNLDISPGTFVLYPQGPETESYEVMRKEDYQTVAARIATRDDAIGVACLHEYEALRRATFDLHEAVRHLMQAPFVVKYKEDARDAACAVDLAFQALDAKIEELKR